MVSIAPFATAQQMAERSEGAIPANRPFLATALGAASKRIRDYCGWHIAPELPMSLTLAGRNGHSLYLPSAHVVQIVSITDGGVPVDVASLDWSQNGIIDRSCWTTGRRSVVVSLAHGFEEIPDDLVDLTLMMASRALGTPLGVVREQNLSSSITFSQAGFNIAGGTVLMEHEKTGIEQYRLGHVV